MKILKKYWFLIIVLVLAAFLRFYRLGSYPALNADEAAIGYNAYSLVQTGMDEHGNAWPIHFQSFNDYKPGLYFYIVLPFVKLFGLNAWSVRVPGAAVGVLTVLVLYWLVKELKIENSLEIGKWRLRVEDVAALFLAISPWHIQFSRGGWEVNTATFLILLGVLLFLKAVEKPRLLTYIFSVLSFALSLYCYHAARIVAPLLGIGLVAIYRKEVFSKKNLKILLISFSVLILLLLPLARDLFKGEVLSRAAGVGLFADPGPINRINEQRGEHGNINSLGAKLIHNKVVNYGLAFLNNWVAHYHGLFLFVSGDDVQRDKVPETGEMYLIDALFVVAGLIFIARKFRSNNKSYSLILYWLLIAPTAAALTFQAPSALRSQNMVIPLVVTSSIGFISLTSQFSARRLKIINWLLLAAIALSFMRYLHLYWVHMAKEYPFSSQYGVKELAAYIKENGSNYNKIVITDKYDQPYILLLFYLKYPPSQFQFNHILTSRDGFGFSTVREFDKYRFVTFFDWNYMKKDYPNSLIVGSPDQVPQTANIIKRIYGENGYEYFDIIAN